MNWFRRLINHFGFARDIAKPSDPLIERADATIDSVEALRIEVVPKDRAARFRALDLQVDMRKRN